MQPDHLIAMAFALAALGLLLLGGLLIVRLAAERRSERTLVHALDEHAHQIAAVAAARAASPASPGAHGASSGQGAHAGQSGQSGQGAQSAANAQTGGKSVRELAPRGMKGLLEHFAHTGIRWLDTPVGRQFVADEDRRLLEQCGFVDTRTRGLFLIARVIGGTALPLVAGALAGGYVDGPRYVLLVIVAIVCGVMLPKLALRRRAAARRRGVVDELPMLVDLLRLLQGVGLSLDQSLQVMVNDFRGVLPVLSSELEIAQRQFAAGRTREQSLNRLAASYENEDLRAVVRLLIQVDRHGGAVQEPLKQFGERLRETRRAMLRERIGRLAVKMTGVMIMTLLPALMIVTAGPGVLSVSHALSAMNHR